MLYHAALLFVATTMASPQATIISPILFNPPTQLTHLQQDPLPVSVRFEKQINQKMLDELTNLGARIRTLPSGKPVVLGNIASITIPKMQLGKLESIRGIVRVESSIPTMYEQPLYETARQIQADQLWWPGKNRTGNMGEGITIADIESAWDIFHPDYFNPDAGYVTARDSNGDGVIADGDEIDLDGDGQFESKLSLLESGLEVGFQPDLDWLYVDENEDNKRNYGGPSVTDLTPAFGEAIFIGDDINKDGVISDGEKLVRLGTSKVKAIYDGTTLYKRGENLSRYPRDFIQENIDWNFMSHGTGAAGIAVAGWPGLRRHTGIAPAADLVLVADEDKVGAIAMTQELGADIVFHEWNDWQNFQDGSTNIEQAVSNSTANNQIQVAPAGNLANAAHIMNLTNISQTPQSVSLSTDDLDWHQYRMFNITFTWKGSQSDIQIGIRNEDDELQTFQAPYSEFYIGEMKFQGWHDVSDRGTSMVMVYASLVQGGILPERVWDIEIKGSESIEKVRGVLLDDRSGWGQGVSWITNVSDNGSALSPATADTVIAVGAYGGVEDQGPWGSVGYRRAWSGMGPRIDGQQVVDVSSPDDPMVCASRDNEPDFYAGYGRFGGTSGATPHVAGAAALMLGSGEFQSHEQIEEALTRMALEDEATGNTPNEAYGYGKIRTALSVFGESLPHDLPPRIEVTATRNEGCELVLNVAPLETGLELINVDFDIWYNGHLEYADSPSIILPELHTEIPIVIHATESTGAVGRLLYSINPSTILCEPRGQETGGCMSLGAENMNIFILLITFSLLLKPRRRLNP